MKFAVVRFPGSCDEQDALKACALFGHAELLWHRGRDLAGADVVVIPGGFSYGDYLRPGALARFSPIMERVTRFAHEGGMVLGICNGFQILCEAGLVPGALLVNESLRFVCRQVSVSVENTDTALTRECARAERLSLPVKHGGGRYYASAGELERMRAGGQILFRYADRNPNGSTDDIAGVCNERRNVFALMPHPEHAVDPLAGSEDGSRLLGSLARAWQGLLPT